ncbi:L-2-hydroxyglutarate dehydrogenase, mitochondrial isoform X2 [Bacillus rossius redtenbacheri]
MAAARELLIRHPRLKLAVVEKEAELAYHQTGHNSGVIHAGVYYTPGSLKAKLCVQGMALIQKYCDEKSIPYKKCGKLIVATDESQLGRLQNLYERGSANKVPDIQLVDQKKIREIEPNCRGIRAVWSPHTGIVDYGLITRRLGEDVTAAGGTVTLGFQVTAFRDLRQDGGSSRDATKHPICIAGKDSEIHASYVLTCAGLHSDHLAQLSGCSREPRIIPFRGEYLSLSPSKAHLIRGNIYPVPDPRFPFLGVHFTPRMDGSVWIGPNAVLAFKREGYSWTDIDAGEMLDVLGFSGFRKLAVRHLRYGASEMLKSLLVGLQVKELQKVIPGITARDVARQPAGVRAQAVDGDGNLVDDFVFETGSSDFTKRILHCRNAPSPAATSSLAIASMIADRVETEFKIR